MLTGKLILIAEDNLLIATGLAECVEDHGGVPLGPVATNREALALIERGPQGAILDGNLLDGPITPVATALWSLRIPIVVYTGAGLPEALEALLPRIPLFPKPLPYDVVVRAIGERLGTLR